jgi:hypothetical protein
LGFSSTSSINKIGAGEFPFFFSLKLYLWYHIESLCYVRHVRRMFICRKHITSPTYNTHRSRREILLVRVRWVMWFIFFQIPFNL